MLTTWYLPSFYGDIRLESTGKQETKVTVYGLSPQEKLAMTELLREAEKQRVVGPCWNPSASRLLDLDSIAEQTLELKAPISKVQKLLQKQLKPNREQVSVVRFGGGKMQEMTERLLQDIDQGTSATSDSTTPPAHASKIATAQIAKPQDKAVATTVASPQLGCPAPDFVQAEVRAAAVLRAFLTPEQLEDFLKEQAFVATGVDTGKNYVITSRHARTKLAQTTRSLYCINESMPYCVHDWEVPAAEEMLSLLVHLSIPTKEMYLRGIRDIDHLS